jgi:Predicted integral membrane protein
MAHNKNPIKTFVKRYWRTIGTACVILYLSTAPGSEFEHIPSFQNEDKVVHFLMYFGFAFILLWDLLDRFGMSIIHQKRLFILIIGLPVIWGGSMELIQQFFTTTRSGDWLDELTNTLGAISGFFAGKWILPTLLKRKK